MGIYVFIFWRSVVKGKFEIKYLYIAQLIWFAAYIVCMIKIN